MTAFPPELIAASRAADANRQRLRGRANVLRDQLRPQRLRDQALLSSRAAVRAQLAKARGSVRAHPVQAALAVLAAGALASRNVWLPYLTNYLERRGDGRVGDDSQIENDEE